MSGMLRIPDDCLGDVVRVIRAGLAALDAAREPVQRDTRENLIAWAEDAERFVKTGEESERPFGVGRKDLDS